MALVPRLRLALKNNWIRKFAIKINELVKRVRYNCGVLICLLDAPGYRSASDSAINTFTCPFIMAERRIFDRLETLFVMVFGLGILRRLCKMKEGYNVASVRFFFRVVRNYVCIIMGGCCC